MGAMGRERWTIGRSVGGTAGRSATGAASRSRSSATGDLVRLAAQVLMIAVLSVALLWLVSIYASGLRDPRYLDGWLLAGGMGLQIHFHIALKRSRLSPRSARRWRKAHILVGYLLIAAFLSHSDFSLPDTGLEWALWTGFVLVTLTGILGTWLASPVEANGAAGERPGRERIMTRRAELAQSAQDIVTETALVTAAIGLPAPPYEAWVHDLYSVRLKGFFEGQRSIAAHLLGSHLSLKRLTDEIDDLSRFVDHDGRAKLAAIKALVLERHRLDTARVHLALSEGWQLIHVPVTYGLVVLSVLHVVVAYAFSSGAW